MRRATGSALLALLMSWLVGLAAADNVLYNGDFSQGSGDTYPKGDWRYWAVAPYATGPVSAAPFEDQDPNYRAGGFCVRPGNNRGPYGDGGVELWQTIGLVGGQTYNFIGDLSMYNAGSSLNYGAGTIELFTENVGNRERSSRARWPHNSAINGGQRDNLHFDGHTQPTNPNYAKFTPTYTGIYKYSLFFSRGWRVADIYHYSDNLTADGLRNEGIGSFLCDAYDTVSGVADYLVTNPSNSSAHIHGVDLTVAKQYLTGWAADPFQDDDGDWWEPTFTESADELTVRWQMASGNSVGPGVAQRGFGWSYTLSGAPDGYRLADQRWSYYERDWTLLDFGAVVSGGPPAVPELPPACLAALGLLPLGLKLRRRR